MGTYLYVWGHIYIIFLFLYTVMYTCWLSDISMLIARGTNSALAESTDSLLLLPLFLLLCLFLINRDHHDYLSQVRGTRTLDIRVFPVSTLSSILIPYQWLRLWLLKSTYGPKGRNPGLSLVTRFQNIPSHHIYLYSTAFHVVPRLPTSFSYTPLLYKYL